MTPTTGRLPGWIVNTQAKVAAAFGVQPRTARGWFGRGAPKGEGRYDLLEVAKWLGARDATGGIDADPDRADWKGRATKAEAQLKELKLAREQGSLYERTDVEKICRTRLAALRTGLDSMPAVWAQETDGLPRAEAQQVAERKVYALLAAYGDPDEWVALIHSWQRIAGKGHVVGKRKRGRPRKT